MWINGFDENLDVIGYRVWILWCRILQVRCDGGDARSQEVGDRGMGVKLALCGGADEGGEDLLGVCAPPGAIAAADFAGDDSGADGLLGAPVGGVDGGVAQKADKQRSPFGAEVVGEASNVGEWFRMDDAFGEAGGQHGERLVARGGRARAGAELVAQAEGLLQRGLDLDVPTGAELVLAAELGEDAPGRPIYARLEPNGDGGLAARIKVGAMRTRRLYAAEATETPAGAAYGSPLRGRPGRAQSGPIGSALLARTDAADARGWRFYRVTPAGAVMYDEWIDDDPANGGLALTRLRAAARRSPEAALRRAVEAHGGHAAAPGVAEWLANEPIERPSDPVFAFTPQYGLAGVRPPSDDWSKVNWKDVATALWHMLMEEAVHGIGGRE